MKYRILLNDDDERIEKDFLNACERESELKNCLIIDYVQWTDKCKERIENEKNEFPDYDAVIFDANGKHSKRPEAEPDKHDFEKLIYVARDKKIMTFIYSGTINTGIGESNPREEDIKDDLTKMGFIDGKNKFTKGTDPTTLLWIIKDELDDFNAWRKYYVENEYLLDFIENRWLSREQRSQNLDPIMKALQERNLPVNVGNPMRHILRALLSAFNERFNMVPIFNNEIEVIKAIWREYGDNPLVSPFIGPLWNIHYLSNAKSHVTTDPKLLELFFETTFGAFRLMTHFFHMVMTGSIDLKKDKTQSIILKIEERDDSFLYSGDFQIVIRKEWEDRLNIDTVIKVKKYVDNINTHNSYKYFVNPRDYVIIDDK